MHPKNSFDILELLDRLPCETDEQLQDRIRRNVSAAQVRFVDGRLVLTENAIAQLARAVIAEKLPGCVAKAYQFLRTAEPQSYGPDLSLSIPQARWICQEVISGRLEGNVANAKKLLAQLNREMNDS